MYLANDGCHPSFPAMSFFTGIKCSLNSVNCSGGGKRESNSNFQRPHKEVIPREMAEQGVYTVTYDATAGKKSVAQSTEISALHSL